MDGDSLKAAVASISQVITKNRDYLVELDQKNGTLVLKSYLETVNEKMPEIVPQGFYMTAGAWFRNAKAQTDEKFKPTQKKTTLITNQNTNKSINNKADNQEPVDDKLPF